MAEPNRRGKGVVTWHVRVYAGAGVANVGVEKVSERLRNRQGEAGVTQAVNPRRESKTAHSPRRRQVTASGSINRVVANEPRR